jgi:hypothetical protein
MQRIGGMRLVAALIDFIIAGVAAGIVQRIVLAVLGPNYFGVMLSTLLGAAIVLGYFYLEVLKGLAVGKMIFKYTITGQDGSPASQQQLMKRYIIKLSPQLVSIVAGLLAFSSMLYMLVAGIGGLLGLVIIIFALMMLRSNKLAYYDEMANTAVYGPGTMPAGFPVGMPGQTASTTTTTPPPTA